MPLREDFREKEIIDMNDFIKSEIYREAKDNQEKLKNIEDIGKLAINIAKLSGQEFQDENGNKRSITFEINIDHLKLFLGRSVYSIENNNIKNRANM